LIQISLVAMGYLKNNLALPLSVVMLARMAARITDPAKSLGWCVRFLPPTNLQIYYYFLKVIYLK
jgi:hypothetical protein